MTFDDQKFIVGLLKQGMTPEERASYKRKAEPFIPGAYPDYGKSIVTRSKKDPHQAGLVRGTQFGTVGAALGALIAKIISDRPSALALGAAGGAALGGIPGYISGSDEAKSDYSKLLFLRRLGVRSKGEERAMTDMPGSSEVIMDTEEKI